jgi:hypothetical protein
MTRLILAMAAAAALSSCDRGGDTRASILTLLPQQDYFHLSVNAPDGACSLERTCEWQCSKHAAEVLFDSAQGTTGVVRFTFRDGAGQMVYQKSYINPGLLIVCEDTAQGNGGTWSTQVHIENLKGAVTITASAK